MASSGKDTELLSPQRHVTTIYATLQGIIQGAAVILLTGQCFSDTAHFGDNRMRFLYAAASLAYVIQITFKYTVLMAGPYSLGRIDALDIAVVIILGVFEYIPMYFLALPDGKLNVEALMDLKSSWVIAVWSLAVWGFIAYWKTNWNLRRSKQYQSEYLELLNETLKNSTFGTWVLFGLILFLPALYLVGVSLDSPTYPMLVILYCASTLAYDQVFLNKLNETELRKKQDLEKKVKRPRSPLRGLRSKSSSKA